MMAKREAQHTPGHEWTVCVRQGLGDYSFRNWTYEYCCPACARTGKFNLNFLGQRQVICDGQRFIKRAA